MFVRDLFHGDSALSQHEITGLQVYNGPIILSSPIQILKDDCPPRDRYDFSGYGQTHAILIENYFRLFGLTGTAEDYHFLLNRFLDGIPSIT